jgi:hypothetical protein
MASLPRVERWLKLAFLAATLVFASPAAAQFWSNDFSISEGDVNETSTSLNNQRFAAVDDSNNLYITFFDNRNKVGSDDNYEIYFRRFIYNFGSPTITRVTTAPNPSRYPSIANLNWGPIDAATRADSGRIYLAWQDSRLFAIPPTGPPRSSTIFFRTFQSRGGRGFGPEIQVNPYDSLNAASAPVLAVGDSSRVWVVWPKTLSGNSDTDLEYAIYNRTTRVMGPVLPLVTSAASTANNPSIATTKDGVVHLVWEDNRASAKQQIFYKKFTPGLGWSAEQQIVFVPGSGVARTPSLFATRTGRLHLVWRDNRDTNNEIYYKQYVPGVGWDAADTRITTNALSQIEPQVDADLMDNVYVVWTDFRNGASNPDIYYTDRKGGSWGAETPLVSANSDTTNSVQHFPGITHDGTGLTYVTWTDERLPASLGKNKEAFYKVGFGFVTAAPVTGTSPITRLLRNYPNPFNPRTTIEFALDRDAQTSIRVFDVQGRMVRTLVDSYLSAGRRSVSWDGLDDGGAPVASGVYFLRLEAGGDFSTRSVNLLK